MKKYFILIIALLCAPLGVIKAEAEALLPMPTEAEMKEIQQFLDTLSPEELDELAKIGEDIIKEAEAEGRPLFGPAPTTPTQTKPTTPAPKQPEKPKETTPKVPEKTLSKKEKTSLQKMISTIVEAIASIRQKATSDEKLMEVIAPMNGQLSNLTYYLNVINYSKHLVHLTDKEFTPLRDNLKILSEQLDDIDNELEVPELEVSKKLSSSEQKQRRLMVDKAESLLHTFMDVVTVAINQKHIIMDFERLLKKYEPEALKIKQDQEAKAKKAGEQKSKLPTTNTGVVSAGSRGSFGGPTQNYTGGRPGGGGSNPFYQSYAPSGGGGKAPSPAAPSSSPSSASKPTTPGTKPADPKKEDPQKANKANTLTAAEQSEQALQDIKSKFRSINMGVATNKDRFHSFVDTYLPDATGTIVTAISDEMSELFDEASFALNRVKKDITTWLGKVNKHTTTAREYKQHVKKLKDFMKNDVRDALELHEKIKANKGALPNTPRTNRHKSHLDQFNTRVDAIYKELDKPL